MGQVKNEIHPLKNWRSIEFLKDCLSQVLLCPFLNVMSKIGALLPSLIAIIQGQRAHAPSLQFPNQTRSNSFSFKHQGYCFLRQKFYDFYCNFLTIYNDFLFFIFYFFNCIGEIDHFTLDLLKRSDT